MLIQKIEGINLVCDKCGKTIILPFEEASPRSDRYIQRLRYTQDGKGNDARHICPECAEAPQERRTAALAMVRVGI